MSRRGRNSQRNQPRGNTGRGRGVTSPLKLDEKLLEGNNNNVQPPHLDCKTLNQSIGVEELYKV